MIESTSRATPVLPSVNSPEKNRAWLRRLGVAGFLFFLIKGLLWLILPALIALGIWT